MTKWIRRTLVPLASNGTTTQVAAFPEPEAGNFLLAVASAWPSLTTPTGWTAQDVVDGDSTLAVWTKTAVGDETSLSTTLGTTNNPAHVAVYEFPPGTTIIDSATETAVARSGVAAAVLSGLPGTAKLLMHLAGYVGETEVLPNPTPSWADATITDFWSGQSGASGTLSTRTLSGYLEDSVLTDWSPTVFLASTSGFHFNTERISLALALPVQLDTPVVTVSGITNPTTPGGSDGTISVTWPAVAGADTYEAGIANGLNQTGGFVQDSATATSPYTFEDLTAGQYTVAIRAHPAP